jgi:hypothetical protein
MHPQRCNPLSFIMNLPMNYLLETLILARGMERIKFHLAGLFRQSRKIFKRRGETCVALTILVIPIPILRFFSDSVIF